MQITPKEAADAVKLFADQKIIVRVVKKDKEGNLVRDPETKRFVIDEQDLAADHVIGLRDLGDSVSITVADGRKYQAEKSADKPAAKTK